MRPPNMPSHPESTYKDGGWQGWGHWLGTGNTKSGTEEFLPFGEALAVARSLRLANSKEWEVWRKEGTRPPNVPSRPDKIYKDGGWQGWVHWLGTGSIKTKDFLPFGEALVAARSLGLANVSEWKVWCKEGARPPNVSPRPDTTYKDGGWQGWRHWLGTGCHGTQASRAKRYLPFGTALAFARALGLANTFEWQQWCKEGMCPPNVPRRPDRIYKDSEWQGWGHWLGTGNAKNGTEQFLPFSEALAFAQRLGLASNTEWRQWCKDGMRPRSMPFDPNATYKDGGWQGWGHWLGTSNGANNKKVFLPFGEALVVARSLNLASVTEWRAWCKEGRRPPNVPSLPSQAYKDGGWQGWGHWLGTGNQASGAKAFLPFDEALRVARSLRLVSSTEWQAWCRTGARPANVPACPNHAYAHGGWAGWEHWLCHANPTAATATANAHPRRKRAAPGRADTGKSESKRRRR